MGLAMRVEKHRNIRMPLRLVLCLKVKNIWFMKSGNK
jgi:hypothetical protein